MVNPIKWALSKAKALLLNKYIFSLVRGLMKAASGFLLGIGVTQEQQQSLESVLVAVLLYLLGQLFSWAEARTEMKKKPGEPAIVNVQ